MAESNVVVSLIADIREFTAKMDEAEGKLKSFGKTAEGASGKFNSAVSKASSAVLLGFGGAAVYAVKSAYDFQDGLEKLKNAAGLTEEQMQAAGKAILNVSNQTGVSAKNITSAYTVAAQAGLRNAAATDAVSAAAKASVITGQNVADITKTIVGIQTLQIAKGESVAQITGQLVKANQMHVGSLDQLSRVLTGKAGAALANFGVNLSTAAAISDVTSKAGLTSTRSFTSLTAAVLKMENPTKAMDAAMKKYGVNQEQIARDAKKPGGFINVLQDVNKAAEKAGAGKGALIQALFGSQGAGTVNVLLNNLGQLKTIQGQIGAAGSTSLNQGFKEVITTQLAPQLNLLKTNLQNTFIEAGKVLLPAVTTVVGWASSFFKALKDSPGLRDVFGATAAGIFAAAIAVKIAGFVSKIKGVVDTVLKTGEAAKTTAWQGEVVALLEQIAVNTGGLGKLGTIGEAGIPSAELAGGATVGGTVAVAGAVLAVGAAAALSLAEDAAQAHKDFNNLHASVGYVKQNFGKKSDVVLNEMQRLQSLGYTFFKVKGGGLEAIKGSTAKDLMSAKSAYTFAPGSSQEVFRNFMTGQKTTKQLGTVKIKVH